MLAVAGLIKIMQSNTGKMNFLMIILDFIAKVEFGIKVNIIFDKC